MIYNGNIKYRPSNWAVVKILLIMLLILFFAISPISAVNSQSVTQSLDLDEIEKEINAYVPDPRYEDDPFILVTVKEALLGSKEHNGGIGACLVCEATGEIVEQSHNRQHDPYFRSDLHAEMDLLNHYEDKLRTTRSTNSSDPSWHNPRSSKKGLVIYTSVEPCPMCLTRIINSGIKKVYYAAPDDNGGMAHRVKDLPPVWRNMEQGMVIEPARCSPGLKALAEKLFHPRAFSNSAAGH